MMSYVTDKTNDAAENAQKLDAEDSALDFADLKERDTYDPDASNLTSVVVQALASVDDEDVADAVAENEDNFDYEFSMADDDTIDLSKVMDDLSDMFDDFADAIIA